MRADLPDLAVLFDLDGTLIDTAADLAAAMNHALAAAGRPPVAAGAVRHLVGHGARAMLAEGFSRSGAAPSPSAMDAHVEVFLAHYLAHIADFSRPFPGAVAAIEKLRGMGAKIAICTNKRERPARLLIETLGLTRHFDAIVGMDTIGVAKPDPAPARLCLQNCKRNRGVFVGDSDTDMATAAAAGMPALAATFGYGPLARGETAFARFSDYRRLPDLVVAAAQPRRDLLADR